MSHLLEDARLLDVFPEQVELQALECARLTQVRLSHVFSRTGGTGLDDAKVPTCSCGWRGRPVEGWRDDQSLQLAAQEYQHRMDGVTPQALREGGVL